MSQPNYVNGSAGTIATAVFVTQDTTLPKAVNQASGSGAYIVGVSAEYSQNAPLPGQSALYAANAQGDPIKVFTVGETCLLNASSAGWTAGDRLTANASGQGVTASGAVYVGAIALTSMTGLGLGQVQVIFGDHA
jgi:hypothetical protein